MRYKGYIFSILIVLMAIIILTRVVQRQTVGGEVVVVSVSSDGHYAITTDAKNTAIVWDLRNKTHKIISRDANMYSAYWIKHTPYYMRQNLKTKKIHITDVNTGRDIETFHPSSLMYGEAMSSNLEYFVGSDIGWNIYVVKDHYLNLLVAHYDDIPGFAGANKLVNFTFVGNDKVLTSGLTSGANDDPRYRTGVFLWDLKTRKPLHDYKGNQSQTFATVSPDGQYVVAGDIDTQGFVWDQQTGKRLLKLWSIWSGKAIKFDTEGEAIGFTTKGLIKVPKDFAESNGFQSSAVFAIKFIDKMHYLRFTTNVPYAILYKVTDPKPLKYFYLGRYPMPSVDHYERDQSIDTSASAHILVMGKASHGGILVYRYDPKKQTLKKIWDS